MIKDIIGTLIYKYDRSNLTIQLPDAFQYLKGQDSNFEMVTSNTIQPVKLFYEHNIVNNAKTTAFIFVATRNEFGIYEKAIEKGEIARKLFEEVLEFQEVEVFVDMTQDQMAEKMTYLKELAFKYS